MTKMVRSRDSRKSLGSAALGAAVLLIVIIFSSPLAPYIRGLARSVFVLRFHNGDAEYAGMSNAALISRLQEDERQLSQVRYQSVLYGILSDENAKLRAALNASHPPSSVAARVIARPPETAYDTVLVDLGSVAGIQKGDVAEYDGIAIGKIVSTSVSTALIEMFSSPGVSVDVLIGKEGAIAVAQGMGGGAFELSLPGGIAISEEDPIRLSGSEPYLVAMITSVSSTTDNAALTVRARSPLSFGDMDFIEIVPGIPK